MKLKPHLLKPPRILAVISQAFDKIYVLFIRLENLGEPREDLTSGGT